VGKQKAIRAKASPKANTEANAKANAKANTKANTKANKGQASKGRVVITHSTYIPGLIDCLEKLANCPDIQTITPAVISRAKSNAPQFRLKVSVPINGGYKLIARKGKSAQEVFVITAWSQAELEQAVSRCLGT
jgi:hypothetical protein